MSAIISFHTRHDANVTVAIDGRITLILECERLFGRRYFRFSSDPETFRGELAAALAAVDRLVGGGVRFDDCILNWVPAGQKPILKELVGARRTLETTHHRAHAAGTYFQSPFDSCLVVSTDGGGDDGWFNLYECRNRRVKLIKRLDLNLGSPYRFLGCFIREIRGDKGFEFERGLSVAGKLMGLAAYGRFDQRLYEAVRRAMRSFKQPADLRAFAAEVGLPFEVDCLGEREGRDLAFCIQKVCEELIEEVVREHLHLAPEGAVCLTGGCALNVLSNSNLVRRFPAARFWVPPNPNDCGISLGSICDLFPSTEVGECAWAGIPLLDLGSAAGLSARFPHRPACLTEVAALLTQGRIIGLVQGAAEHGPRALGNRSILASAGFPGMKDILNRRVKGRELYRPFAPVVVAEEAGRYFDLPETSPYMSFSGEVREPYRRELAAITHTDHSARVQTLEREDNALLYDLLRAFERVSGLPVLLNTSLNIKGRPIVAQLAEAFEILETTDLDLLYYDGQLFAKPGQLPEVRA